MTGTMKTISINLTPVTLRWTESALGVLSSIDADAYDLKRVEFEAHFRGQRANNGIVTAQMVCDSLRPANER